MIHFVVLTVKILMSLAELSKTVLTNINVGAIIYITTNDDM